MPAAPATNPTTPAAETDTLAEAIKKISAAVERLARSGLNQRAIVALVHDDCKVPKKIVAEVLSSLESLARVYARK